MGAEYSEEEIPADLVNEAREWREKMLEIVSEFDDAVMEKFFDDPSAITEDESSSILKNLQRKLIDYLVSAFINKNTNHA
jgi:elongation factor G